MIGEMNRMTIPIKIDKPPNTPKYIVSETCSYTRTSCALIACAAADAKNQRAIVCPAKAAGANFVVADNPTGDSNNSPNTHRKIENTTHNGLTNVPSGVNTIAAIITKNETPAKNNE